MNYEEMVKFAYEDILDSFEKEAAPGVYHHYDMPDEYKPKSDYERLQKQRKMNTPSLMDRLSGGALGNTARDVGNNMRAGNSLPQAMVNVSNANASKRKENALIDNEMGTIKKMSKVYGVPKDKIMVKRFGSEDELKGYIANRRGAEKVAFIDPNRNKFNPSSVIVDGPTRARIETPAEKEKKELDKRHPILRTLSKIPGSARMY